MKGKQGLWRWCGAALFLVCVGMRSGIRLEAWASEALEARMLAWSGDKVSKLLLGRLFWNGTAYGLAYWIPGIPLAFGMELWGLTIGQWGWSRAWQRCSLRGLLPLAAGQLLFAVGEALRMGMVCCRCAALYRRQYAEMAQPKTSAQIRQDWVVWMAAGAKENVAWLPLWWLEGTLLRQAYRMLMLHTVG